MRADLIEKLKQQADGERAAGNSECATRFVFTNSGTHVIVHCLFLSPREKECYLAGGCSQTTARMRFTLRSQRYQRLNA